jgi:hypothetical protein
MTAQGSFALSSHLSLFRAFCGRASNNFPLPIEVEASAFLFSSTRTNLEFVQSRVSADPSFDYRPCNASNANGRLLGFGNPRGQARP